MCGDPYDQNPRDHEPGGKYATGVIVRNYTQGQEISATIDITANHDGYFEFRLCQNDDPMKIVEQDCFDKVIIFLILLLSSLCKISDKRQSHQNFLC